MAGGCSCACARTCVYLRSVGGNKRTKGEPWIGLDDVGHSPVCSALPLPETVFSLLSFLAGVVVGAAGLFGVAMIVAKWWGN